eukprot:CFRG2545T1
MSNLVCDECGETDFGDFDEDTQTSMCQSCGHDQPPTTKSIYSHYAVAKVENVGAVKGNPKCKLISLNVGADANIQVVTNAKYISEGEVVVVALPGATVPAGSNPDEDSESFIVVKTTVGGVGSHGMLCDAPALAWKGAKDKLVKLSANVVLGSEPPASQS